MSQETLLFACNEDAIQMDATNVSQRTPLNQKSTTHILLVNESNRTVHVRAGDVTVEATLLSMPILAGEKGVYSIGLEQGKNTHLAFRTAVAAATLLCFQGQGS